MPDLGIHQDDSRKEVKSGVVHVLRNIDLSEAVDDVTVTLWLMPFQDIVFADTAGDVRVLLSSQAVAETSD